MNCFPGHEPGQWAKPTVAPTKVPGFSWTEGINQISVVDASRQPPQEGKAYQVLIPRTDDAGHEVDALRLPVIEVYLPWLEYPPLWLW